MREHSALAATLITAALVAARLLAISRFDVNTAATILQASGVGTAVAGTALTLLPFALVLATCALGVVVFLDRSLVRLPVRADLLFCVSAAATVCLAALALVVVTLVVVVTTALLGVLMRHRGQDTNIAAVVAEHRSLRIEATFLVVMVALTPIVLQRPWLPLQEITLGDDSVLVGYVLGESDGRVAVMEDGDRTVRFLDPDQIEDRSICSAPPGTGGLAENLPQIPLGGSVLGVLLWGDEVPDYPACPQGSG